MGEVVVVYFGDFVAGLAEQELCGVFVWGFVDASDEGGEAFDAVDEALLAEEFEGAVDCGGCGGFAVGAELVEQVVGAGGGRAFEDEAEDLAAQFGEFGAILFAEQGGAIEGGRGTRRYHIMSLPGVFGMQTILDEIGFDERGLVAAVAQQHDTGEVLMVAWMNREAVAETLATGQVCYFSRSRGGLWRKGETSGQRQRLVDLRLDCDGDTVLLLVDQLGVACHTGRRNCFYRAARDGEVVEIAVPLVDPEALYGHRHG